MLYISLICFKSFWRKTPPFCYFRENLFSFNTVSSGFHTVPVNQNHALFRYFSKTYSQRATFKNPPKLRTTINNTFLKQKLNNLCRLQSSSPKNRFVIFNVEQTMFTFCNTQSVNIDCLIHFKFATFLGFVCRWASFTQFSKTF